MISVLYNPTQTSKRHNDHENSLNSLGWKASSLSPFHFMK